MDNFNFNSVEVIRHAVIAFGAGIAHALNNDDRREELTGWAKVGEFVASTVVASFSGVIFGLLALQYFGEGNYMTLAVTGGGGFAGAKGLKIISDSIVVAVRSVFTKGVK